ncbi:MAG: hypothetical protein ACLFNQ_02780 [Spirochaetaceae bacterium]
MNRVLHNPTYQREAQDEHTVSDTVAVLDTTQVDPTPSRSNTPLGVSDYGPVPDEPARRFDYAIDAMERTPAGIGFPGAIFQLLVHTLEITSGALLIRDVEDSRYKVWASCGLDPTTRGRMIMKRRTIDALVPDRVAYLDETDRSRLGQYLSVRERSMQEPVLLCRFQSQARLCGLLVIFRSEQLFKESWNAELLLAALSEPVAHKIGAYRETPLQHMIHPLILDRRDFSRSVQTTARRLISSPHGLVCIRIGLNSIADAIVSVLPFADPYHVTRDVRLIAASFFAAAGDVTVIEPDSLIAAVTMPAAEHGELLIEQLSGRLGALLPELPDTYTVDALVRQWPVDSEDVTALLEILFERRD